MAQERGLRDVDCMAQIMAFRNATRVRFVEKDRQLDGFATLAPPVEDERASGRAGEGAGTGGCAGRLADG